MRLNHVRSESGFVIQTGRDSDRDHASDTDAPVACEAMHHRLYTFRIGLYPSCVLPVLLQTPYKTRKPLGQIQCYSPVTPQQARASGTRNCLRALRVRWCTRAHTCAPPRALSSVIVQEAAAGADERGTARRFEIGPAPDGDLLKDHRFGEPPSRREFGERRVLR